MAIIKLDKKQQDKENIPLSLEELDYALSVKGKVFPLSENESQIILDVLTDLRQGKSVSIVSDLTYMTTQQAAEVLNVSRPYLIKILDQGEIPFIKVGNRRKILEKDVFSYKERRDKERRQILREFSIGIYEDGLYDLDYEFVREIINED